MLRFSRTCAFHPFSGSMVDSRYKTIETERYRVAKVNSSELTRFFRTHSKRKRKAKKKVVPLGLFSSVVDIRERVAPLRRILSCFSVLLKQQGKFWRSQKKTSPKLSDGKIIMSFSTIELACWYLGAFWMCVLDTSCVFFSSYLNSITWIR